VGDETESYEEVIFGQRRPDSLAIDWTNKMLYVLEFKRTSDQRRDYRERGESRAMAHHDVLIRSLEKVAGETEREGERWKVKLIVFVGGACGSVLITNPIMYTSVTMAFILDDVARVINSSKAFANWLTKGNQWVH
jgi:hypothetical protein